MAGEQIAGHSMSTGDAEALLRALLEAPLPSDERPPQLEARGTAMGRRASAHSKQLGVWIDELLQPIERFLIVFAVLMFGHWLLSGPVRGWLREQQISALPPAVIALAAAPRAPAADPAPARMASGTEAPAMAPADEFIAPRQGISTSALEASALPTHLLIPSIAVDSPVKEVFVIDDEWQVADYAAGYLHGTGLPGDPGNVAMAGHAGLNGGVFRDLGSLAVGADVYVDAAGWRYHYRVRESKAVWPNQLEVLDPTPTAILTLVTCTNWDTQRLVVIADLIGAKPLPDA